MSFKANKEEASFISYLGIHRKTKLTPIPELNKLSWQIYNNRNLQKETMMDSFKCRWAVLGTSPISETMAHAIAASECALFYHSEVSGNC